jgi:glutaminyl-tRNA synthetase
MPTIVGLRRRGYTPEALHLFTDRIGVSKSDSWIDYSTLEGALRDTLDPTAKRAMAVLDPIPLEITNWDELHPYLPGSNQAATANSMVNDGSVLDYCTAPVHPHHPELGKREFRFGKMLWIERGDYEAVPSKGFFRLYPGNKVRLKYGHVIECTGATTDAAGNVTAVQALLIADTKSGTPGSDAVKVKGVITWVAQADAVQAEVRLYDRLFKDEHPDAGGKDFLAALNPDSLKIITAYVEPSLGAGGAIAAQADDKFQFERHGYFVADRKDHGVGKAVFNKITGLKDTWAK